MSRPMYARRFLVLPAQNSPGPKTGRLLPNVYPVGSFSPFLRLASRFYPVFGSKCSQVVPKFLPVSEPGMNKVGAREKYTKT